MPHAPSSPEPTVTAPRLARALPATRHDSLIDRDEWSGERVVGGDLAGQLAAHLEIDGCELQDVLLTGAHLERLRLADSRAQDCELSGTMAHEATLVRVEFRNCRMSGAVFSPSALSHVRFVDCKLDDANFRFAKVDHVVFEHCSLVGADFYGASLSDAAFAACDLRNTEFSKASVPGVRLVGSVVEGVKGVGAMAGVVIATDQVLPLALSAFRDLGIVIESPFPDD